MSAFESIEGVLHIDSVSAASLAKQFGTPLYVYAGSVIDQKLAEIRRDFLDRYQNARAAYASKAFLTIAMAEIIDRAGLSLDVVSGGELYTAMQAKFPPERMEFHGNNKSEEELVAAIDYGVGVIIVDAPDETAIIEQICAEKGTCVNIMFRISPEVDAHTHDFISTGKKDSKFGFPLQREILFPHLKRAIDSPHTVLKGIHFHIGSQLHDNATHLAALAAALDIYRDVKETFGYLLEDLNIGGGFGIHYTDEDNEKPYAYFLDPVMAEVSRFCAEAKLPKPTIVIEPGRSIVGEAGITLYRVGSIKTIEGVRKYVSVDGGMSDNIRPALYGAKYECVLAEKTDAPKNDVVTICGKLCETGDKLITDAKIAQASRGDLLAVFSTGAYGYSMASNYNKNPIPGVVFIEKGIPKQIVRRQTFEDLIRNELSLDHS